MSFKSIFYLLLAGVFVLSSCSSDDGDTSNNNNNPVTEEETLNYFPLAVGNNWDFENTLTSPNQEDIVSNENLSITNTVDVNGMTGYELESDNVSGSGPTTLALTQGTLFKENSSLKYTGVFGLGLENFPEVNFNVENTSIFDTDLPNETEMFSESGTIEQEFEGIPISIDYTLSTIMGDDFENFTVNGVSYDNVISSQLIVNLKITANITNPFPISFTILQSQDAITVNNYFANGIGLIQSETNTNLVFEEIPIPDVSLDDISFNTLQIVTDFSVTTE